MSPNSFNSEDNQPRVSFDTPQFQTERNFRDPRGMVGWIMKASNGKVSSESRANMILAIIAALILSFSGVLILKTLSSSPSSSGSTINPDLAGSPQDPGLQR